MNIQTKSEIKTIPAKKLTGSVAKVLQAAGDDFVSQAVERLELTYDGIVGDYHAGLTRDSGAREPWYPRGTEMRNERHLTILSEEELAEIAAGMGLDTVEPSWIGCNLVVRGIAKLSYLPPRTLLMFEGGVTLRVDGYNAPCTDAGGSIAKHTGVVAENHRKTDMALSFVKAGHMKRGVVAWVEREGTIRPGEAFTARIWEQWIY